MKNLNTSLANLITAFASAQQKNHYITFPLQTELLTSFKENQAKLVLSETELSSMKFTLERIQIEEKIDTFIFAVRKGYEWAHLTNTIPNWLIRRGTTEEIYQDFFANISSVIDDLFDTELLRKTGMNLASVQELKHARDAATEKESLQQEGKQKIREAWDLRNWVVASLLAFGYTHAEVNEIEG